MGLTSTIILYPAPLKAIHEKALTAAEKALEATHTDLVQSQTMPFRTGNLQNESTFVDSAERDSGAITLVTNTPYARRLYFHPEYHFYTGENPSAGGEWLNPYLPGGEKQNYIPRVFARFLKGAL